MKKRVQGFICGILTGLVLFMCISVFAQTAQTIQAYFNRLNLKINGELVARAGQTFTLHDGRKVPYTILYQDTTYLPLREMCRLLDKDIEYDGTTGTISITDKTDTKEPENGTADKGGGIVSEQQYVTHKELASFIVKSFNLKDKGIRYNIEGIEQNDPYYIDLCIVLSVNAAALCPAVDVVNCPYIDGIGVHM